MYDVSMLQAGQLTKTKGRWQRDLLSFSLSRQEDKNAAAIAFLFLRRVDSLLLPFPLVSALFILLMNVEICGDDLQGRWLFSSTIDSKGLGILNAAFFRFVALYSDVIGD
jgi:hypothetical protein